MLLHPQDIVPHVQANGLTVDVADDHLRIKGTSEQLTDISVRFEAEKLLLPLREGELIEDLSRLAVGDRYALTYPGTASMKCVVMFGGDSSIFIGGRPSLEYTRIQIEREAGITRLTFSSLDHDYVVIPFDAEWREAADRYSDILELASEAAAEREPRYLVQLGVKDPFGNVHISHFEDLIPIVDRIADHFGQGHIAHFFGTSEWGFDRMFPDYTVDPSLGGENGFRRLTDYIAERGLLSSHHYNPRIADSDWLANNPEYRSAIVSDADGPIAEPYKGHVHYVMSPNDRRWYDRCFETIDYLYDLGLDYLEIDQFTYQRNFFDSSRPLAEGYKEMVDEFVGRGYRFWLEGVSDIFRLPPGNFYQILIRDRAQRWEDGENRRGYPFGRTYGEFFMHLWPDSEVSYQVLTENQSLETLKERLLAAKRLNASLLDLEFGFYDGGYLDRLDTVAKMLSAV